MPLWPLLNKTCNFTSKINANYEKWCKTAKSNRVLEASFFNIFEKLQLSTSQNNMNFVVGALKHIIGIFTIHISICMTLFAEAQCTVCTALCTFYCGLPCSSVRLCISNFHLHCKCFVCRNRRCLSAIKIQKQPLVISTPICD